jgi:hypothetical protein
MAIDDPHWKLVGFDGPGGTTIENAIFLDTANVKSDSKGHVRVWALVIPFVRLQEVFKDDPRSKLEGLAGLNAFAPMLEEAVMKVERDPTGMTLDCKSGRAKAEDSTTWDNVPPNSPIVAIEQLVCPPPGTPR